MHSICRGSPVMADGHRSFEPSQRVGFSGNRIDRQSETRPPDALAKAKAHASASYILFTEDRALVDIGRTPNTVRFWPDRAAELGLIDDTSVFLGNQEDQPILAGTSARTPEELPDTIKAVDLRSLALGGNIAADELGAVAQGRSLLLWHETHRFCANCGQPTEMSIGGLRRDCPACGRFHFPRTDPVVIMLAIDGDRCLLGRSHRFQPGMYSCLAGFMEPGETIEDAVRRETAEESGVQVGRVHYHASQPWPFPSSLMIGCHGEALSFDIAMDVDELEDCRWFSRNAVHQLLSHTHPGALICPPNFAIAHELIRAFADGEVGF